MKQPLFFIACALMVGIVAGAFFSIPAAAYFSAAGVFLCLAAVIKQPRLFVVCAVLLFFCVGVILITPRLQGLGRPDSVSALSSKGYRIISGVVAESPEMDTGATRIVLTDLKIKDKRRWRPITGRLRLTVGEKTGRVSCGDTLFFTGKIKQPHSLHNPGGFDYEFYLRRMGIDATSYVPFDRSLLISKSPGLSPSGIVSRIRDKTRRFYDTRFPTPEGAVLKALVLGERGDIPDELLSAYYRTGVGHVLAISGSNVGIVFFFGYFFVYSILVRCGGFALRHPVRRWAVLLAFLPVVAYSILAGFEITVVRAMLMIAVFVLSVIVQREPNTVNTLVMAALTILIFFPESLFDPSFQLSFTAVLAIILLYPPLIEPVRRRVFPIEGVMPGIFVRFGYLLVQFAAVTIAALIGILPFSALYFFRITPMSLPLNFVVVPLLGPIATTLCVLSVPFIFIFTDIAYFLNLLAAWATSLSDSAVLKFDSVFPGGFSIFPPRVYEIVLYYALLISAYFAFKRRRWAYWGMAVIVLISVIDGAAWWAHRAHPETVSAVFLSVGNGDSTLITLPHGTTMLVDSGGISGTDYDIGQKVVLPFLFHERVGRIDYLVLSHPERDHAGGMLSVMKQVPIGEFWIPKGTENAEEAAPLIAEASARDIPVVLVDDKHPDRTLDGATIRFLNPPKDGVLESFETNNRSLVFRLSWNRFSLLMTGDIERDGFESLLARGANPGAVVLKAPHHGSPGANDDMVLAAVRPIVVVVSCGFENSFGFPGKTALAAFDTAGAHVFRTDMDGAVRVVSDKNRIEITTMTGKRTELLFR